MARAGRSTTGATARQRGHGMAARKRPRHDLDVAAQAAVIEARDRWGSDGATAIAEALEALWVRQYLATRESR